VSRQHVQIRTEENNKYNIIRMGFLRSEDMHLYKFLLTKDNAYQTMRALGKANAVHFLDMNKSEQAFKLPYTDLVKRCEEAERRIM
jgi:hypothetical protein